MLPAGEWLVLWAPFVLLLYLVLNGGSNMTAIYRFLDVYDGLPGRTRLVLIFQQLLCGWWGLPAWAVLAWFAYRIWGLAPQWPCKARRGISLSLLLLIVLTQEALICPLGDFFCLLNPARPPSLSGLSYMCPDPGEMARAALIMSWFPHIP